MQRLVMTDEEFRWLREIVSDWGFEYSVKNTPEQVEHIKKMLDGYAEIDKQEPEV